MPDAPDTLTFGAPTSDAPGSSAPPDTLTFGTPTVDVSEPSKWTGTAALPYQAPTWSDTAHEAMAGIYGTGANIASNIASRTDDDAWQRTAESARQAQQASIDAETYGGREAREGGFWSHPIFQTVGAAPGLAAAAAPAVIGGMVAGPAGAVVGGALGFGEYQRGQAVDDYSARVMATPATELKQNPKFDQFAQALPEDEAKRAFVRSELNRNGLPWKSELLGAAVGAVGPAAEVGGAPFSKILGDKLVNRFLAGGLEQSANMAVLSGGQTALSGQAEQEAGLRGPVTSGEIASSALSGGIAGAQFGIAGAALHRPPIGGENVANRSGKADARKPEAQEAGRTPGPLEAGARQPASPLADPTLAAGAKGETITPESNQQAQPVEQQPTVAQPAPSTAGKATEAPPAPVATEPVSPPPGAAEPAPAPAPAAPEQVIPEPPSVIAAQHQALLDPNDPRDVMIYNPDEQPIEITGKRYGQVKLPEPDGRIVQFDRKSPRALTVGKVRDFYKNNDLNTLLQYGPVNKDEAVARSVAGEEPAVVATTTDAGVPVKEAAGTTATAPSQVAAQEATKGPGDTVSVKPESSLLERQAPELVTPESKPPTIQEQLKAREAERAAQAQAAEQAAATERAARVEALKREMNEKLATGQAPSAEKIIAGEPRLTPELEAARAEQAQRRVLRSETPEEQAAAARQAEADRIAAERVATEKPTAKPIKEKEEMKEKNLSAEKRDELLRINRIGDEAVDAHPIGPKDGLAIDPNQPGGQGARTELLNRVRAMVKDATDKGYKFMKPLRERIGETNHTNKNILLHEADLLGRKKIAKTSDIRRYLNSEHELLHNGEEGRANVMKMRSETGREFAGEAGKGVKEVATEGAEGGEARAATKEGVHEGAAIEKPDVGEEYEAAKERVAEEKVAKEPGVQREMTEMQRAAIEAGKRAAARVAEEERVKAAGGRERPTVTRESDEEPAVKGYGMATGFKVAKAGERQKLGEAPKVNVGEKLKAKTAGLPKGKLGSRIHTPEEEDFYRQLEEEHHEEQVGKLSDEELAQIEKDFPHFLDHPETMTDDDWQRLQKEHPILFEDAGPMVGPEAYLNPPKEEEPTGPLGPNAFETSTIDGRTVTVDPIQTMTAKELLEKYYYPKIYDKNFRPAMERLRDAILRIAGDVKVHILSQRDMERIMGPRAMGLYDSDENWIGINAESFTADTPPHEVFHAATAQALRDNPDLAQMMVKLHNEAKKYFKDQGKMLREDYQSIEYFMSKPEEFLTGLMTNQNMQRLLKGMKISAQLAKEIGIPAWRRMTAWEGAIAVIRKALGLDVRDTSAIEAALSISEQTMWRDPRGQGAFAEAVNRLPSSKEMLSGKRGNVAPPERDQEAFLRSPRETLSRVKDIDANVMKQYGKDTIHNLGGNVMRGSAKLLSGTWLNDIHGHLFSDAKGKIIEAINNARNKVSYLHSQLMDKDKDIINRGYMLDKLHASHMPNYARLLDLSQRYNIHADRDAPTISKNPVDEARKNWQRDKFGDEARALYRSLPEELQKRYTAEKKHYMDKQAGMATAILDKILPMFDAPKGSTLDELMERAHKNDMTDDDWSHYEDLGIADRLHEAYQMANKKDVYFNSQRDGRYVVSGRYEMPKGGADHDYSGSELPDNVREFNTEADAHKYATSTRMKATTREIKYYKDPDTGEIKKVAGIEAASLGTITPRYRVSLERQNFQAAASRAEAERNRQAMEADGVKELSGVMDKRDEKSWSSLNSADQQLLERKLDSRKDLNDAERQHMKDVTRQMMLASRGGMGAHMIQARKVAGAKFDTAAGLHSYTRAINFHTARQSHITELDDAMDRLDAHEKAMRSAEPDSALRRSIVANELRDRVYGANANALSSASSPLVHRLMTWAFLNFLARPSHILLSQIHPYIYSVPMMAARHGYWKSLQGQRQAMKDLGGMGHNLLEGAKAGYQVYKSGGEQNIDKAVAMAHGVDPILRMINGLKDKGERDAMMRMWETEHLHSAFDASVFSGGGLDRTNAVVRQFTDAMEANNRLSTALNAYRLERDMHKDPANALAYSRRVIEQTHGVFSPTNAATIFKNPIIRPIMQFRQQPMNLAIMMYRNIAKSLPEKWGGDADNEARWTLAYQLGTAAALGGMGGMPMDLPKLVGLAGQAVGGPSPADWDDKFYRTMVDLGGETTAKAIHDGIPGMMGPFGPSLGHRTGFDAGFLFGEPKSDNVDDLYAYFAKSLAGASVGMGFDWLNALHQAEQGNFERAAEGVLPGSLKDFMKAYRLGTQGQMAGKQQVTPPSFGDELLQILGFSGVEREQKLAGHFALQKALKAQQAEQAQTKGAQLKAKHAAKQSVLGVPVTAKERAIAQEYQRAYQ